MKVGKVRVKKGQIWKQKRDGVLVVVRGRNGDDWFVDRVGKPKVNHHMAENTFYKYWELVEK